MDPDEILSEIEQVAQEPQQSASDGQSASSHPLPDLIETYKFAAEKSALSGTNAKGGPKSGWGCLRTAKAKPPGAI